ncbi:hypothetical protein DPMN_074880 [Dreissena polymorpha]|uniref:Uncharacterized protein n=1 Tax=Dreissena polymorpha TaxID=45954 RepID=A0A9D4BLZ4_DREPO|nr:hypothetical protein DPMN_074880 [Dreissena polymorpha]
MLEYQNEPTDINEAMFHVVNFIQSRGSPRSNGEKNHRNKKWTRRTTECMVADIEDEETSETANRVPSRITREETPPKTLRVQETMKENVTEGMQSTTEEEITSIFKELQTDIDELKKKDVYKSPRYFYCKKYMVI